MNEVKRNKRFTIVIGNPPYANFGQLNKIPFILQLLEDYKRGLEEKKINLDDDFIKFVRLSQYLLDAAGTGLHGMITNNVYFDGITHRQMRRCLLNSFGRIRILNVHGSTKRGEISPDGSADENVFDILIGVGISIFAKHEQESDCKAMHGDLWGTREFKYDWLGDHSVASSTYSTLHTAPPHFFFVPKELSVDNEYHGFEQITSSFRVFGNGIGTDRDDLFYDFERDALENRIRTFYSAAGIKEPFASTYRVQDSSSYALLARRSATKFSPHNIRRCLYRPFDVRWLYYQPQLTSRAAYDVMKHVEGTLTLLVTRQVSTTDFRHVFVSKTLIDRDPLSLVTRERSQAFPLYLRNDARELAGSSTPAENVQAELLSKVRLKVRNDAISPEDIFKYAYAVFHSPEYRSRYTEFLKIDFPRLPLTGNLEMFRALANLGGELVALHLLESPKLDKSRTEFIGGRNPEVEKVAYSKNTVWIDKAQTTGFRDVPEEVWNFHIGGYQVCEKWLKDRKGRTLSKDDIAHYHKIVIALTETIRIMGEIDKVIEQHGGWPGAFQTAQSNSK